MTCPVLASDFCFCLFGWVFCLFSLKHWSSPGLSSYQSSGALKFHHKQHPSLLGILVSYIQSLVNFSMWMGSFQSELFFLYCSSLWQIVDKREPLSLTSPMFPQSSSLALFSSWSVPSGEPASFLLSLRPWSRSTLEDFSKNVHKPACSLSSSLQAFCTSLM